MPIAIQFMPLLPGDDHPAVWAFDWRLRTGQMAFWRQALASPIVRYARKKTTYLMTCGKIGALRIAVCMMRRRCKGQTNAERRSWIGYMELREFARTHTRCVPVGRCVTGAKCCVNQIAKLPLIARDLRMSRPVVAKAQRDWRGAFGFLLSGYVMMNSVGSRKETNDDFVYPAMDTPFAMTGKKPRLMLTPYLDWVYPDRVF